MLIGIVILFFWIVFALLQGLNDSYYYHYRMTSNQLKDENIHWVYFCQRFIVCTCIGLIHSMYFPILSTGIFLGSLILIFSFFHNGMYYQMRKKISHGNLYPKGWFSSSTTSQATIELNNVTRIFLAIVGIIGIIASFQINI